MHTLHAPIDTVIVYNDHARITRRAQIDLSPGEHTLVLKHVAETLAADSVRARAMASGVIVRGVDVHTDTPPRPTAEEIQSLESELDALLKEDLALQDEVEVIQARFDFLETFREKSGEHFASAIASDLSALESVTAVSHYITQQMSDSHARRREIEQQRADLKSVISEKKREVRRARREPQQTHFAIHIHLEIETAGRCDLDVTYVARAERWRPHYDVRLTANNEVELNYMASVIQRTGEDWQDVQLTLSTARPAISASLPTLAPWYLDEESSGNPPAEPEVDFLLSVEDTASTGFTRPDINGSEEPPEDWLVKANEMLEDGTAEADEDRPAAIDLPDTPAMTSMIVTYNIEGRVRIPSDGQPHRSTIMTHQLVATIDYVTAPKLVTAVFLRACITNTSPRSLLAGEVSLFHEQAFIGRTDIPTIAPSESFNAQFGVDEDVQVIREQVSSKPDTSTSSMNRCTQYAYRLTLTNRHDHHVSITVTDQLPVSKHSNIKARLKEADPRPAKHDALNTLEWHVDLAAGQQTTIQFAFTVEHPRGMKIEGLDL